MSTSMTAIDRALLYTATLATRETLNTEITIYSLKHYAEDFLKANHPELDYRISVADITAALLKAGFRSNSMNIYFNIRKPKGIYCTTAKELGEFKQHLIQ